MEGTALQGARVEAEVQSTGLQGTARQFTITPRTLIFEEDQAGPSMPIVQEQSSSDNGNDETIAEMLINMSRPRGVIIQEPEQVPQSSLTSSQAPDPKDKGKGILVEPPKKKKLTLRKLRELEAAKDEELARKIQEEWNAEELQKQAEQEKKQSTIPQPRFRTRAQERNFYMSYLKGQGYKGLHKLNYFEMKQLYDLIREAVQRELEGIIEFREDTRSIKRKREPAQDKPSKKKKLTVELKDTTMDELGNYLRIVDFDYPGAEANTRSESLISTFEVVNSKEGDYLVFHRDDKSFKVFNMLLDLLHIIDRRDLIHLYQLV